MKRSICECSKLAQKGYKARHDLVGKLAHLDLFKNLKFDYSSKWYMHNQESAQENEMHKLLWDFEIQTDHQISARRPDLIIVNNNKKKKKRKKEIRTCKIMAFTVPADNRVKFLKM